MIMTPNEQRLDWVQLRRFLLPRRFILSLCDFSGSWSQPYVDAGYEVIRIDSGHPSGFSFPDPANLNLIHVGMDLLSHSFIWDLDYPPWGVLAAPPCTCLTRAAACRWPKQDAEGRTARDLQLFKVCWAMAQRATGWWALENPPGRHRKLMPELPAPAWQFQPWQYGDPWTKQTYIWGTAKKPEVVDKVVEPATTKRIPSGRLQGPISRMSSSWKRQRAQTPAGFAQAFFKANQ
jgi:hypothetical protein